MRGIVIAFLLFLPLVSAPRSPWDGWVPFGAPCSAIEGSTLHMQCESSGLLSPFMLDLSRPVTVTVQARGTGKDRYWAGLALNSNPQADTPYAEIAIERGIAPYQDNSAPWIVSLATPAGNDWTQQLQAGDTDWHQIAIIYTPGRAVYVVDGIERGQTVVDLGEVTQVELLCVAVNPGESQPGAMAACDFRDLTVL